jgi:ABC-type lipoprotein export system ATPase subunit
MLELKELSKQYRSPDGQTVTALYLKELQLGRGEQVVLAGPSGSGKTTLLHLVAGLVTPTTGAMTFDARRLDGLKGRERDLWRARNVGYIFQNYNLLNNLSALENILAAMAFARVIPTANQRQRAEELLKNVGLTGRFHHRPYQLSGGEQQRVAVARALANRPHIILADEPTASLDRENSQKVLELLTGLCREQGNILILATHDQEVMGRFARTIELQRAGGKLGCDCA